MTSSSWAEQAVDSSAEDVAEVNSLKFRLLPVAVIGLIAAEKFYSWRRSQSTTMNAGGDASWNQRVRTALEFLVAFTLFCISGPGLILLNKHIFTKLAFGYPMTVSNMGNIFLVMVMRTGNRLGYCTLKKPVLGWDLYVSNVLPLSVCTSLSIVVGNVVYLYISLPLIQILKSGTLVLVMLFGFVLGVERFRWGLVVAIITMVAGISLAMQSSYDSGEESGAFFTGVFIMTFGNIMEAIRAVMLQVSVEKLDFTDSLYWCSPTMALVGLSLAIPMEWQQASQSEFTPTLVWALVGSGVLGGCVSFSTFWITKLVGGLSVKVLVNARNIGLILYSVVILGEKCADMEYVGYSIALIGIALYDRVRQGPAAPSPIIAVEESTATAGAASASPSQHALPSVVWNDNLEAGKNA